jgi:hypothetical protein
MRNIYKYGEGDLTQERQGDAMEIDPPGPV